MNLKTGYRHFSVSCLLLLVGIFAVAPLQAEYLSVQSGRTARLSEQPKISVEAGVVQGDFGSANYSQLGVRMNYLLSPDIVVFGDIGQSEVNNVEETSLGGGVYYSISDRVSWSDEIAIKLSYHQAKFARRTSRGRGTTTLDCGGVTTTIDPFTGGLVLVPSTCRPISSPGRNISSGGELNNLVAELLFSGAVEDAFADFNTHWYLSAGVHSIGGAVNREHELAIGGGFVFPTADFELYAGIEHVDQSTIGFGLRYIVD